MCAEQDADVGPTPEDHGRELGPTELTPCPSQPAGQASSSLGLPAPSGVDVSPIGSGPTLRPPHAPDADHDPLLDSIGPGTLLDGRYLIVRHLGTGGMGSVFLANDQNVADKPVAVKFIRRGAFDDQEYELFRAEMATLAGLDSVPGVVKASDSNLDDPDHPYIVTEFINGWDLREFVRHIVPSREDIVRLAIEICQTLHAVHDEGVVHRDIKPTNILVRQRPIGGRWVPVIVDFGVAMARRVDRGGRGETNTELQGGTPRFMSPEHARGPGHTTRRSDVFSLGVVLYWLLTDTYPYDLEPREMVARLKRGEEISPRPLPPERQDALGNITGVPSSLARIVLKAIAPDPMDRFRTAADLGEELRRWLESATGAGTASRASPTAPGTVGEGRGEGSALSPPATPIPTWQMKTTISRIGPSSVGEPLGEIRVAHLSARRLYDEARAMPGIVLGPWRVSRFLGMGVTGMTFIVTDQRVNRPMRLKILYPPSGGIARAELVWETLDRVASRGKVLEATGGVVGPQEIGSIFLQDTLTFFVLSEYTPGQELLEFGSKEEIQVRYGGISAGQLEAAFELVSTLDRAQRYNYPENLGGSDFGPFHGRVVSSNVIVRGRTRPVLLDYGMLALAPLLGIPDTQRALDRSTPPAADALGQPIEPMTWLAQREAYAVGLLLKSFLFVFNDTGWSYSFAPAAQAWPNGEALLSELRQTIRQSAAGGPTTCRAKAMELLSRSNLPIQPGPLVSQLLRFVIADLTPLSARPRLTNLREVATRIAEAAAIGPGASREMLELLDPAA